MSNTTQKRRSRLTTNPIGNRKRRGLPSLGTAGPDLQPSGEVKIRRKKHFTPFTPKYFTPKNALYAAFAKNLLRLMNAAEVYPSQLARETGLQKSNITKWLQGTVWPTDYAINKLLDFFNVKKEDLIPDLPDEAFNMPPKGYTIKSVGKDRCHITVNEEVPKLVAYKILGILDNMNEVQENEQKEQ